MENFKIVAVHDWHDQNDDYIYHYTNIPNAVKIIEEKVLRIAQSRIHQFGSGVFMTKVHPKNSDTELIQNNYRGNWKFAAKVQCAFAFDSQLLKAKKFIDYLFNERDLWRNDSDIYLHNKEFTLILRKKKDFHLITVLTTQLDKQRMLEQEKIAEQNRIANQKRIAEQNRIANQKRIVEQNRIANQKRMAEQNRIANQVPQYSARVLTPSLIDYNEEKNVTRKKIKKNSCCIIT